MARIKKILIANRGEIACRIIRTAHELGYETVAVYSDADTDAPHALQASEAVHIGPSPVGESYLSAGKILAAAKSTGADAVHPGYGFLSENADFARACGDAGITFIGPSADAILKMGNKAEAKRLMIAANVPCVPGYEGEDQSEQAMMAEGKKIGFPVMVKAAAGGGGRGMRLVKDEKKLAKALKTAASEAMNAFGSGELILEKAILEPRHIEIQVFGDDHGNVIHLFERDCSVQRRHQKVIEEAPSPAVSPDLRAKMGAAAVKAAKSINYSGAGTVEFLLDSDGHFYFLEMNTRLQVEHPVTEMITGLDLVEWQLEVAAGKPLPLKQEDVSINGHAVEVRLYAEDPYKGFLPKVGRIVRWAPAAGPGLRHDHGLESGREVTPFYDGMIAKVIAHGQDRDQAIDRLARGLFETACLGLVTNKSFLIDCLQHDAFRAGLATTAFIETYFPKKSLVAPTPNIIMQALAAVLLYDQQCEFHDPAVQYWQSAGGISSMLNLKSGATECPVRIDTVDTNRFDVFIDDQTVTIVIVKTEDHLVHFECDDEQHIAMAAMSGSELHLCVGQCQSVFEDTALAPTVQGEGTSDGRIVAPMNGRIVSIAISKGDDVKKGQVLARLEAMKMEHEITANIDGHVTSIDAKADDQVTTRQLLMTITAEGGE